MYSSAIGPVILTEEKKAVLNEGIGLIFSRWTAMRAAVETGFEDLKTNVEDGSVDQVTKVLLTLYKDCRYGIFEIIKKLRLTKPQTRAIVFKIPNGNNEEDEDEESDGEDEEDEENDDQTTDMMVDGSEHCSNGKAEAMTVDEPSADDGWTVYSRRKNKGKRN